MSATDPCFYVRVTQAKADGGETVDISDRVLSLVYTEKESTGNAQSGGADKLVLSVDNFDLSNFDKPVVRDGNRVEVSWGYPGNMSPPRTCTIQKVTGSTTLEVTALGMTVLLHKQPLIRTHEQKKYSEIAAQIAQEAGYGSDLQHIDDTEDVIEHVSQARMTNAMLMREMCRRTHFVWYIDFDGFHFHPRKLGQKPARVFTYYRDLTGDILTFNVENDIFARKAGGVTVQGRNPDTKKPIKADADNASANKDTTLAPERVVVTGISSRDGSVTGDFTQENGSTHVSGGAKDDKAAAKAAAGAYANNQLTAAQLTMECRGDPSTCAKSVVQVKGIGRIVEGNYYLKEVTHSVGQGYTMSCKGLRSGRNSGQGGVAAKGALNNANAPAPKPGDPGTDAPLLAVNNRDGSVSFVEGRGRSLDGTPGNADPAAPADPLGLVHQQEDAAPDGGDPGADPLGLIDRSK